MKILHGKHNRQYKLRSWELKLKNKTKQKKQLQLCFEIFILHFYFTSYLLLSLHLFSSPVNKCQV